MGLPTNTSVGRARPTVSAGMGKGFRTIQWWWCFRQSGEQLRGREVKVDEQYDASGLIYARIP